MNLLKQSKEYDDPYRQYDEDFSYMVWIAEKNFNVGPIGLHFPVGKFLNIVDKDHTQRFNESQKPQEE